ncbi:MAG: hypothetical protein A2Y25_01240 [Candidatus Melainabacteria bacterium GWF2_37_15]|nr:MAG: hypothetical protein A2Y25_01240 [Candidatus Melainabacteria bacterium GWF2_37_15]
MIPSFNATNYGTHNARQVDSTPNTKNSKKLGFGWGKKEKALTDQMNNQAGRNHNLEHDAAIKSHFAREWRADLDKEFTQFNLWAAQSRQQDANKAKKAFEEGQAALTRLTEARNKTYSYKLKQGVSFLTKVGQKLIHRA